MPLLNTHCTFVLLHQIICKIAILHSSLTSKFLIANLVVALFLHCAEPSFLQCSWNWEVIWTFYYWSQPDSTQLTLHIDKLHAKKTMDNTGLALSFWRPPTALHNQRGSKISSRLRTNKGKGMSQLEDAIFWFICFLLPLSYNIITIETFTYYNSKMVSKFMRVPSFPITQAQKSSTTNTNSCNVPPIYWIIVAWVPLRWHTYSKINILFHCISVQIDFWMGL